MKKKYITVKWLDHASASEWQSLEDIKKWVEESRKKPCVSRGEVVYENKDVVVISGEHDGHGVYGNATMIYKKLIVKK